MPKIKRNGRVIPITMGSVQYEELEKLSRQMDISKSEVVRVALRSLAEKKLSPDRVFKKGIAEKKMEMQRNIMGLSDGDLLVFLIGNLLIPNGTKKNPDKDGIWYDVHDGAIVQLWVNSYGEESTLTSWTRESFIEKLKDEERI